MAEETTAMLLKSHTHVFSTTAAFVSSMALNCAIDLGIADAIHQKGGRPVTLQELVADLALPPARAEYLSRLMRLLVYDGYFSKGTTTGGDVDGYVLTPTSAHLIGRGTRSLNKVALIPASIKAYFGLSAWLRDASPQQPTTPFHVANGAPLYEYAGLDPEFNESFNAGISQDAELIAADVVAKLGPVLGGVRSLLDVGGGNGMLIRVISEAFPHLECRVLELPHVVAEQLARPTKMTAGANGVSYVVGDMFEYIPRADIVLLKYILHCCRDEECVKILKLCKNAIPTKADGGRVVLVEAVVNFSLSWLDVIMLTVTGGKERTEKEWEDIFVEAGFRGGYKMTPVLDDFLCIIELFP